jgi:hypothetical protein
MSAILLETNSGNDLKLISALAKKINIKVFPVAKWGQTEVGSQHRVYVIPDVKKERPVSDTAQYRKQKAKVAVLQSIRDSLKEIRQAKHKDEKLQSLNDFLHESGY